MCLIVPDGSCKNLDTDICIVYSYNEPVMFYQCVCYNDYIDTISGINGNSGNSGTFAEVMEIMGTIFFLM